MCNTLFTEVYGMPVAKRTVLGQSNLQERRTGRRSLGQLLLQRTVTEQRNLQEWEERRLKEAEEEEQRNVIASKKEALLREHAGILNNFNPKLYNQIKF